LIEYLDQSIKSALEHLSLDLDTTGWWGREREVVSLYSFNYLLPSLIEVLPNFHPSQLGIEVAVPQIQEPNSKAQVNKDIVIWPEPFMTCWDNDGNPTRYPVAIMEWKANVQELSNTDIDWLCSYSAKNIQFVGFSTTIDLMNRRFKLKAARIYLGSVDDRWLII
jgi:hypothetical protein